MVFEHDGCMLERKSVAAYSTMSVFHSKSGTGKGDGRGDMDFLGMSDGMDLERDVST